MAKKAVPATKYKSRKSFWTYWLTRDSDPKTGAVDAKVRVWLSQPVRYSVGERGCFWLAMADHFADWSIEECLSGPRVYPDDDRQCIRCGPPEDVRVVKEPDPS